MRSTSAAAAAGADRTFHFDEFHVRFGSDGQNELQGGGERDFFFGLAGDDRLTGDGGDDDLHGDGGADNLTGGVGMDHLTGGNGQDRLDGGEDMDHLAGGAGKDEISAGAGHDMIEGGTGDDVLDGGDGADAFVVDPHSGHDVIQGGFTAGPGAFDHIAFVDIFPKQVEVEVEDAGDRGARRLGRRIGPDRGCPQERSCPGRLHVQRPGGRRLRFRSRDHLRGLGAGLPAELGCPLI